jgi:hypothetical protein
MASSINASVSGAGGLISTADNSGILNLQTAGTTAVTIDASQRVAFVAGTAALPAITTTGDTNTGIFFSAADTIDFAEGGTAVGQFDSSANFKFNSGYGSVATAYGCRAWVNFNGTGTVAIRASGNVTSITDNGAGDYSINFTTAMPDSNYNIVACTSDYNNDPNRGVMGAVLRTSGSSGYPTTSNFKIYMRLGASSVSNGANWDEEIICLSVFR